MDRPARKRRRSPSIPSSIDLSPGAERPLFVRSEERAHPLRRPRQAAPFPLSQLHTLVDRDRQASECADQGSLRELWAAQFYVQRFPYSVNT
jgi:hypothetical protein